MHACSSIIQVFTHVFGSIESAFIRTCMYSSILVLPVQICYVHKLHDIVHVTVVLNPYTQIITMEGVDVLATHRPMILCQLNVARMYNSGVDLG